MKHGAQQEKPKQLFWEKRLEGMHACDIDGSEFGPIELPRGLKPVGPNINNGTLLQSVATALHVTSQPITGQTAPKPVLNSNSGVYLNPEQPLMHSVNISEDDIRRQEDRVTNARKRLQDALRVWNYIIHFQYIHFENAHDAKNVIFTKNMCILKYSFKCKIIQVGLKYTIY